MADIHFDYRLAIAAMENGRIKSASIPETSGARNGSRPWWTARRERDPHPGGRKSGSLEKPLLEKYGGVTAEGIVESALDKVSIIEDMGYDNLVISIKSSDVRMCVKAMS